MPPLMHESSVSSLRGIPVRWVLPLWSRQAPSRLDEELWAQIQQRASNYSSEFVPTNVVLHWRSFALAAFAASPPRNVQRVADRMGAFLQFLHATEALRGEYVETILDSVRIKRFLMSEHVTRLSPGSRQHVARALNAMVAGLMGPPRTCSTNSTIGVCVLADRIEALANVQGTVGTSARRVRRWLDSDDPRALIPRTDATRVNRYLGSEGMRTTYADLQAQRLALLASKPIPGFLILQGKPNTSGFPSALASRENTFEIRQTRLMIGTPLDPSTSSPEA